MDKRKSRRAIRRLPCSFGGQDPQSTGLTYDISETGLCIKSSRVLPKGAHLNISLSLPGNGATQISGKVVRTFGVPCSASLVSNGMGVEVEAADRSYFVFLAELD